LIDGSSEIRPILAIQPPGSVWPIAEHHPHERRQRERGRQGDKEQDQETDDAVDKVELSEQAQSIAQHSPEPAVAPTKITTPTPVTLREATGESHIDISV
jgi:hypothetical protein